MFELAENIINYAGLIILIFGIGCLCSNSICKNLLVLYPCISTTQIMLKEFKPKFLFVRKLIIGALFCIAILTTYFISFNLILFAIYLVCFTSTYITTHIKLSKLSYEQKNWYCIDFLATDVINFEWIVFNDKLSKSIKEDILATHHITMRDFYLNTLEYDKKIAFVEYIERLTIEGNTAEQIEKELFEKPLKFAISIE